MIVAFSVTQLPLPVVYFENFGNDADGAGMTCYLQTRPLEMSFEGNTLEDFIKYIDEIKLKIKGLAGATVQLKVGIQETLEDEIWYSDNLLIQNPMCPIFPNISGRFITLRLEASGVGDFFELFGIIVHGKPLGQF